MTSAWVKRLGGGLVDCESLLPSAEAHCRMLIARGASRERAEQQAARSAVSAALADLASGGSEAARAQLVEIWLDPVHRWCRMGAGPGVHPDDVAHDALLRLVEGIDRLRDKDALHAWLWGVVWRLLREHERRARLRAWIPWLAPRSLEQELCEAERTQLVRQVLAAMPLQDRELLTLAYVEERTREQIASALSLPLGTVNRKLSLAREAFRKRALARGVDFAPEIGELQEYA